MASVHPFPRIGFKSFFPLACILGILCSCQPEKPKENIPYSVEAARPTEMNVPILQEWVGHLTGTVNASILPQISGYLKSQDYQNGAMVKKGDILFHIDDQSFRDQVRQAEARLSEAKAQLQQQEYDKNIYAPLAAKDIVSKQKYEDTALAVEAAKASLLASQAALSLAQQNLAYTVITSPIDGVAGIATVQQGDLVSPEGKSMTEVSSINPIRLNFSVSQEQWLKQTGNQGTQKAGQPGITNGSELEVILSEGKTYPHQARVVAIDSAFNPTTGTIRIQANLPNEDSLLRPGMFVRVRARIGEEQHALTVPVQAIISMQGRFFIVTVDDRNKPHMIPIKVGGKIGNRQVVIPIVPNSVTTDSQVVVEGVQQAMIAAAEGTTTLMVKPYDPENKTL